MIEIRPARREDCPGILEIYNDAVLTTTATYDYEPRTLEQRQSWFDEHQRIDFPIFVAVNGIQRIVGWSALNRYHDRMGYRFTTENSIYIAADFRGQGIGKKLLAPLIDSAKRLGLRAIIAAIDGENEASVRLHAGFGFESVGHFKKVGYKFNRWLDVVYMELLLPEPGNLR
ncbi:MAG TPA: GNAT family N-acetyltransferase [Verrucomicrobiae bacterium]|jgi:phosphinothricin acetyltransferase|nr:GNAT family N-acetyltransferase [Verrucomicrobiae bacterium]